MKTALLLIMSLGILSSVEGQQKEKLYNLLIGTYTQPGKSEGIYVYTFNPETGAFAPKSELKGIKNPSYLAVSKDRKFVYAVSETSEGTVNAYSFDPQSGKLVFLNSVTSGGNGPCYVSVDGKRKFVYTGNYGGGSLSAIPVKHDGSLGSEVQTIKHEGKSVKSNQDKSHVHATVLSKDDRYLFVPDLGTDKVNIYKTSASTTKPLSSAPTPYAQVDAGNGPRHITLDPTGKTAYLIQEMTGVITAFDFAEGKLTAKQSVVLPAAGNTGKIDAADIQVSPDGKFLYGSLRGDINEIVIFGIDKTGLMTYAGRQSTLGKTPRNFAIDPTGNFLLVGNQNSDEIVIFRRDQKTGSLSPTGEKISIGAPVCLKFVAVK